MERLMRLREPAAVIALVGLTLHTVLVVLSGWDSTAPLGPILGHLASAIAEPVLLVLLSVLLVACWLTEPTRHARGLTVAGLALTALLLAAVLALAVAALVVAGPEMWERGAIYRWLVPPVTVAVIGLLAQVALLRRPTPAPTTVPELEPAEPQPEPVDPQQQPTWTPDAAVGTVWRRAGDAASQVPATSWDAPGEGGAGWGTISPADPPTEPTRRSGE
jgi:MFS family permease